MTVTPGTYHAAAYAIGVAGQAYITSAYTGDSASCGANLATVEIGSNTHINNIIITDWCPNKDRPSKLNEVPLPYYHV